MLLNITNGTKIKLLSKITATGYANSYGDASSSSGLSSGLLAFYRLSNALDSSENGYTLTNTNGVSFSSGRIGNAATFSGSNKLSVGLTGFNNEFTFSCWVKRTSTSGASTPFIMGVAGGPSLSYRASKLGGWYGSLFGASGDWALNTWYHVAATNDANGFKFYVNGSLEHSTSQKTIPSNPTVNFGGESGGELIGQIDAAGIWHRALTETEVGTLYNSGGGYEI
jgi:hypothetical protein